MKYFVFIVLSLIGLGVYLRFQNDVTLKENTEFSADEGTSQPKYNNHKNLYGKKNNFDNKNSAMGLNPNSGLPESSEALNTMSSVNDMGYDENQEVSCPYTDANGLCSSEPFNETAESESFQEEHFQAQEINEVTLIPQEAEYDKFLNEQTFDSLRTPASDE
jgi:hypothetical protein